MVKSPHTTIAQYYATCESAYVERMQRIASLVKELIPEVQEKISWGMPTFDYHGNLLHLAQCAGYVGLYPGDHVVTLFQDRLASYKTTKGSIHLPMNKELDETLIKDIILCGKEENEQLYEIKQGKKKSG